MSGAELVRLAADGGLIALAAAALVDLRRRGGAPPAQWGLALVAVAQAAGTTAPGGPAPVGGWLLQTAALLGLLYLHWLMGRVLQEVRPPQVEAETVPARETLPCVRAVASWPHHRRE